jgi:predicted SnoaL-like aldol condensation-catalyzing enzyme
MQHKEIATSFLQAAGMGRVQAAYDTYVAEDFVHHNVYFKGDRQSLLDAMAQASKASPNKSIETIHIYEDGDTVITHSLVTREDPDLAAIAVVHIFRFSGDKIVELWDLGQEIPVDSPNANGAF